MAHYVFISVLLIVIFEVHIDSAQLKTEDVFKRQEKKIAQLTTALANVLERAVRQEKLMKLHLKRISYLEEIVNNRTAALQGLPLHPQNPVVFHVQKNANFTAGGSAATVPFETVMINLGDGWNTIANQFVAPARGIYVFTYNTYSLPSNPSHVWIMHNGQHVQHVDAATDHYFSSSGTAIFQAEQFDQIYCQVVADRMVRGNGLSHFVGFLLHPL